MDLGVVKNENMKWIISKNFWYQIIHHHNRVPLSPLAVYVYTFSTLIYFLPKSTPFSPQKNKQNAP